MSRTAETFFKHYFSVVKYYYLLVLAQCFTSISQSGSTTSKNIFIEICDDDAWEEGKESSRSY